MIRRGRGGGGLLVPTAGDGGATTTKAIEIREAAVDGIYNYEAMFYNLACSVPRSDGRTHVRTATTERERPLRASEEGERSFPILTLIY